MTDLQNRVKLAATARGLKMNEVAAQMGIVRQYLREMLIGTRRLSDERMSRLAEILKVSEQWLQGEDR